MCAACAHVGTAHVLQQVGTAPQLGIDPLQPQGICTQAEAPGQPHALSLAPRFPQYPAAS